MLSAQYWYPIISLLSYILVQQLQWKRFFYNLLLELYADVFVFRYHEACDNAKNKVLELLRGLSCELQDKINILVFCSTLLIIAKALFGHVR